MLTRWLSGLWSLPIQAKTIPLDTVLMGPRLRLRLGHPTDWKEWVEVRGNNRAFLEPWEPRWPDNCLSYSFFCGMMRRHWRDWREGRAYPFLIFSKVIPFPFRGGLGRGEFRSNIVMDCGTPPPLTPPSRGGETLLPPDWSQETKLTLIGGISLSDVRRDNLQRATVGYWLDQNYTQQGFMTEALTLTEDFARETLRLNRLEASCLPHNLASIALLKRMGFQQEGFAESYFQIQGRWQDHLLWGKRL